MPRIRTASRTDRGVHALANACTFDTVQGDPEDPLRKDLDTEAMRKGLNHYMVMNQQQIQGNPVFHSQS